MEITWQGAFDKVYAFPTINRKLSQALERRGHTVYKNQHRNSAGELTPIYITFTYEYNFDIKVRHPLTVGFMTWEFGGNNSFPIGWKKAANKNYDLVVAISDWVGRVFHANGLKNVTTLHMGVDPEEFQPREKQTGGTFTFLWAGGTDKRHGWDLAIKAFKAAFSDNKNVKLLMKLDTNYPPIEESINDPRIKIIRKNVKSMADIYHQADCLLFPVRGVGPGLIAMEAMACGIPVIAPFGSGIKEYGKYIYKIRFNTVRTTHHYKTDSMEPYWMEPELDHLVNTMRWLVNHPGEARKRGLEASDYIRTEWTWDKSAERLEYILKAAAKPIKVSIVILAVDRPQKMLARCLKSIYKYTTRDEDPGFEIVIVDQNMANWEIPVDLALLHPHNQVIRLNYNSGVSKGRNIGIKAARGEYILLLDDDAHIVKYDWLNKLLRFFADKRVGIVGQTGTYIPEGRWGQFWEAKGVTEADVVQGYCQLFPKRLVNKIGFIDEGYGKFWHEDADFCLKARNAGYLVIDANAVGVHHVGSCSGDDGTYGNKIRRLREKWESKPGIRVPRKNWHKPFEIKG